MVDSVAVKAYEQRMTGLPDGVVSQPNALTPLEFVPNYDRMTPEGMALTAPFPASAETLALGERMFGIYCRPCHGDGVVIGTVGQPGRFPAVVPLGGPDGLAKLRTDGYIYLTIRNGGAIMPFYGWAMSDREMWSIVHHVRTLPDAQHTPKPSEEAP